MKYINRLLILVVFSLLPVAGCIQGQATVSLNPDGSGKIFFETVIDPCSVGCQDYRSYLLLIRESLLKSEGIDAWSQVDWKKLPNGKYYFKGQAFFKSVDNVAIHFGQLKCNLQAMWLADSNDRKIVGLRTLKSQAEEKEWQKQNSPLRYKLFASDTAVVLNNLRLDIVFNLPAKAERAEGFEKIDERTVHFLLNGKRMVYLLDYIRQNGLYQLAERCNYDKAKFLNNELLPLYLEKVEPLKMGFTGGENVFDYEKEKTAAKKGIVKVIERLDGEAVKEKIRQQAESQPQQPVSATEETADKSVEAYFRDAIIQESKNEYQQAVNIYHRIIDSNTSDAKYLAQAHYRAGLCYFELGDNENAVKQFEYVIKNFASQRIPAVRSSNMIRDIRNGSAVRKADKIKQMPMVVDVLPQLYVQDVNSLSVDSITILFSQPMDTANWFYSSFEPGMLPQVTGTPVFDESGKNWTLPVKLARGKVYAIAFNCGDAMRDNKKLTAGFRSVSGEICEPFVLVFSTLNDANEPTDIDAVLVDKSEKINGTE
jgi:tetratricopeptide (TPR) repeat protein